MKRMFCGISVCVLACALMTPAPAYAHSDGVSLGATVGTLGVGAQSTLRMADAFNLRGAAHYAAFGFDIDSGNTTFDVDLQMLSLMALIDWHPFGFGLRFTGGMVFCDSSVDVSASFSDWQTIGGRSYPPELIGSIEGSVTLERTAPYVGIGYGNAVGHDTAWSFVFDLGVLFQTYDVSLGATGPAASYPWFRSDLRQEERDLQEEFDKLRVYPVLTFGIARQL